MFCYECIVGLINSTVGESAGNERTVPHRYGTHSLKCYWLKSASHLTLFISNYVISIHVLSCHAMPCHLISASLYSLTTSFCDVKLALIHPFAHTPTQHPTSHHCTPPHRVSYVQTVRHDEEDPTRPGPRPPSRTYPDPFYSRWSTPSCTWTRWHFIWCVFHASSNSSLCVLTELDYTTASRKIKCIACNSYKRRF